MKFKFSATVLFAFAFLAGCGTQEGSSDVILKGVKIESKQYKMPTFTENGGWYVSLAQGDQKISLAIDQNLYDHMGSVSNVIADVTYSPYDMHVKKIQLTGFENAENE